MVDASNSKPIVDRLKQCRHDNHPAVTFAIDDRLGHMSAGCEAEDDGEQIGGSYRWTKVPGRILGVGKS